MAKRKRRNYGKKQFTSLAKAYSAYQKDRLSDVANPALAPRNRFATIWGWAPPTQTAKKRVVKRRRRV